MWDYSLSSVVQSPDQDCGLFKGLSDAALYNINNTPFIMTCNSIATGGIWTLPPGFQRAYWSINFVDFRGLHWQSASVNWMGAEGLQWPYLMKRSCASGDDINKARGHPSSSLRTESAVSRSLSSHPQRPPSGKYATSVKSRHKSAYAFYTSELVESQWEGSWGRTRAPTVCHCFLYQTELSMVESLYGLCLSVLVEIRRENDQKPCSALHPGERCCCTGFLRFSNYKHCCDHFHVGANFPLPNYKMPTEA